MTGREHEAMRETAARLRERFTELAAERDKPGRDEFIGDTRILAWQQHETLGMLSAVNEERARLSKPPVNRRDIELAEGQAAGHCDYATKWPWYCAEIVYGVFPLVKEPATAATTAED